ncbi:hypothetical protein PJIAN_1168 [Paludibacter jiangxiensis]|uniref:Uncharacterized protein n=1 Tax=Paludibacter jiangxiensis TaxID=681398 RepID=A0A170Y866_9BACT|nr:hypothetical protein PJIAN_1168 [Paludibacter jiangxiensis]
MVVFARLLSDTRDDEYYTEALLNCLADIDSCSFLTSKEGDDR